MSIKERLYNSILNYISIDSLYEIGKPHKHETIARKLRELTHEKKILPVKERGAIIAYMKVYDAKVAIHQNEVKNAPQRQIDGNKAKPKVYCRYWINHNCQIKKKCNTCLFNK